jgi:TrpR family trp operon transcriptional repressor
MNKELFVQLRDHILNIDTKEEMEDFLLGILTPNERQEISRRLEIIRLLLKGLPQAEIAERLGVGVATVTRGSRELKEGRFKSYKKETK